MMDRLEPIAAIPTRERAPLELREWAEACAQALAAGERMVTLFGRLDDVHPKAEVIATAVLQTGKNGLRILRGRSRQGQSFPSITLRYPETQAFERELWEQTGLVPEGHPWLKPVRYEGARQQRMHEHPFFTMRGQDVHEVGVGPIHASVIEPGHFCFMCHGEQVHHLEIQLGYQHRGVEALLLRRQPLSLTSLVESIAGDTSVAYAWGYCAAMEALCGAQADPQADAVRGIALELERIAMHLVSLTGLATDIAFLQGGATYGRLRTAIINATMRVCGSRFGRGWLRPGGVRFGISDALCRDLLATLAAFARDFAQVNDLMLSARSVQSRFQGVGQVSRQAAEELGLVGLAARASGVAVDVRASLPGQLYTSDPMALLTEDSGDCWARLRLRMREIDESVRWLIQVLQAADSNLAAPLMATLGPLRPDTLCVSVREGFRGPVVQALETGPDGRLLHYKVQDPSLLNWFGLALAVRDNEISDFPICNKSFDLSYCGNDL
jgi:Ni,Fe-hydrogenase III large subunit